MDAIHEAVGEAFHEKPAGVSEVWPPGLWMIRSHLERSNYRCHELVTQP